MKRADDVRRPTGARARTAVAFGSLSAVVALTYVRLYFGVDFTDESFYTACPIPIRPRSPPADRRDEHRAADTGSAPYPFIALWESLIGLDGIVLYARHLHLFFSGAVALALFFALRRILDDRSLGAVLAGAAIAYVPFGIHGLSYNVFAAASLQPACSRA